MSTAFFWSHSVCLFNAYDSIVNVIGSAFVALKQLLLTSCTLTFHVCNLLIIRALVDIARAWENYLLPLCGYAGTWPIILLW